MLASFDVTFNPSILPPYPIEESVRPPNPRRQREPEDRMPGVIDPVRKPPPGYDPNLQGPWDAWLLRFTFRHPIHLRKETGPPIASSSSTGSRAPGPGGSSSSQRARRSVAFDRPVVSDPRPEMTLPANFAGPRPGSS